MVRVTTSGTTEHRNGPCLKLHHNIKWHLFNSFILMMHTEILLYSVDHANYRNFKILIINILNN